MQMGFYIGNGVYDYLNECSDKDDFYWTSGNLWLLIYGNENCEPKVLTVASGHVLNGWFTQEETDAVHVAMQITQGTEIPVNFVRFDPERAIERVRYWKVGMDKSSIITSAELHNKFLQYGLQMNELRTAKEINDKSSSPYHIWQRNNMGNNVVVTDLDLLRYDDRGLREIIELKRSYIDLSKWEPYYRDYNNFILISRLAQKRHLDFYIVYNHRAKTPFYDDVSRLKIFKFDHRKRRNCECLGYQTIQEFVRKNKMEN